MMASTARPRTWDPLVRITHWGIAAVVILNGLILEGGDQPHVVAGYVALSLLALRLVWGIVGTEEARFSAFPPSASGAVAHVRGILAGGVETHRSHNPLGALMVYALWGALALTIATGLAMEADVFPGDGEREEYAALGTVAMPGAPVVLAERDDDEAGHGDAEGTEEATEKLHEIAANLVLILALVHVGGVAFEMARGDRGLIRRMTTGGDHPGQGA
jgi:cytochrome b